MHANIHKLRILTSFCNCEKILCIFFTKNIPAKKRAKQFGGQENMNFIQKIKCVLGNSFEFFVLLCSSTRIVFVNTNHS